VVYELLAGQRRLLLCVHHLVVLGGSATP
jgi:hypothetical protein